MLQAHIHFSIASSEGGFGTRDDKLITGIQGNPYLSTCRFLTKGFQKLFIVLNLLENQLIIFNV